MAEEVRVTTPDIFTRIRGRAASVIAKYGAPVTFTAPGTAIYDSATGLWSDGTQPTSFTGTGISTRGQFDHMLPSTLVLNNPVTVLVAALNLGGTPEVKMIMTWGTTNYTVSAVLPVAPNDNPIYYIVVGDV